MTLVSWRSHRVKRVVASASAAEAMGSSQAIAQGDWVRAAASLIGHGLKGQSRSRVRTGGVPLIWQFFSQTTDVLAVG